MSTANAMSLIDADELLARCMGNSALVEKLLKALSSSLPVEQQSLQVAVQVDDLVSVARIAHKMKGTAANMCAKRLAAVAHDVEQAARSNQIDIVAQRWFDLKFQIENLLDSLSAPDSN